MGVHSVPPNPFPSGKILDLRLPRSKRLSYKEMSDLLLDKTKDDIWKWFNCKPKCCLEEGLTLVENDMDMEKIFQLANLHGTLGVYIGHIPQVTLVDYYLKNLCVVESDEEVTLIYRSHEKAKKDVDTMSLTLDINGKGKVLLDDFEAVGNGKGRVTLDDFEAVGNGKGKVLLNDSKDGLVSTKGDSDGDPTVRGSSSYNLH
ncbi:hypothetical protein Tco_0089591 [Tanacetum coccineum]